MNIKSQSFGTAPNGEAASSWTITNESGLSLGLSDWGATIISVMQPDRNGVNDNVVLGFNDASRYIPTEGYQGATCGRFANRIAKGRFSLNGTVYELALNNGPNHLHGGDVGYNARIWNAEPYAEGDRAGILFSLNSPDGDENYPGNLSVTAEYALDESGRLYMDFHAETDAATIVNLTNHTYWNLAGRKSGDILNHRLTLHASRYLPVDDTAIPTGELASVEESPFDFRKEKAIGLHLGEVKGGYDHCVVIDGERGELRIAAEVLEPGSGRRLALYTDRPGVQFYSGNFLDGRSFPKHGGFCLEPQDFPDAPNQPNFPSVVLRPGDVYRHRSAVQFSVD